MKKNQLHLNERDRDVIYTTAVYKFLTTTQIQQMHFPNWTLQNTARRLRALTSTETTPRFLTRVEVYPRATTSTGGRKSHVYFVTKKNLATLKTYLYDSGKAGLYDEDFDNDPRINATERESYAPQTLWHELAISQFFMNLEEAAEQHGYDIPFWERTSPINIDISETIHVTVEVIAPNGKKRTRKEKRYFNPDAVFALTDPNGKPTFYILEYDNNTTSITKFKHKLEGLKAYDAQHKYPDLIGAYAHKYNIAIENPDKIGVRVLTVAANEENDHRRRDRLFYDTLVYRKYTQFRMALS